MGDLNYDLSPDRSFIDVGLSDKDATDFSTVTATDMALIRKRSGDMRESLQGVTWRSLPATLNEVESVTREWKAVCSEPAILLTEDMATEDSFKMNCRGKRVIYVATHGFTRAKPVFERSPEGDTEDNYVRVLTEQNPLLQSGIVFSGANQLVRAETELLGDDGIATGEEISCLDLEGVDLVVLSACHTGSGVVVNGEGVYSLRRAFELAGAKTVVSSLWAVDDRVTEELMTRTVRQVGATIGEALHGAMLDRIGELRAESLSDHPFYWAGFICSGDPRTRLFVESRGDSREPSKRE
jgi:CHAT domain-containing protein